MITFIAPAFNEKYSPLMFIGSMACQTNNNWKAIIFHNGSNPIMEDEVDMIIDKYDLNDKISYFSSETNTSNWGTYNRKYCISELVTTSHVIQTSIQDYWMPVAVEEISKHLDKDFIHWNSINHLFGYHGMLNSAPEPGRIDWGNFAIKTDIAKKVGIRYPREFTADGLFVKDCLQSGLVKTTTKLPQILTIHN